MAAMTVCWWAVSTAGWWADYSVLARVDTTDGQKADSKAVRSVCSRAGRWGPPTAA